MALALADQTFDDKDPEVDQTSLRQLAVPNEDMEGMAEKINAELDEDEAVEQALLAVADVANRAGARVGEAIGWTGKLFQKHKPAAAKEPELEFEATVDEQTKTIILAALNRLTQKFAAGEISQEACKSQFAVLMEQFKP